MRLRPKDYQFRLLGGVEVEPCPQSAWIAFGLLVWWLLALVLPERAMARYEVP